MHGHLNVTQFITMHGHLNVTQFITMHGHLNVKFVKYTISNAIVIVTYEISYNI